jgi:hypothetical protein
MGVHSDVSGEPTSKGTSMAATKHADIATTGTRVVYENRWIDRSR